MHVPLPLRLVASVAGLGLVCSCHTTYLDGHYYRKDLQRRPAPTKVDTYPSGARRAEGPSVLIDGTTLRKGMWRFWYEDGSRMAQVHYEPDLYLQCCTGGYCPRYYEVATGPFAAWYPSGKIMAKGHFEVTSVNLPTSCEGGGIERFGAVSSESPAWREDGTPTSIKDLTDQGLLPSPLR